MASMKRIALVVANQGGEACFTKISDSFPVVSRILAVCKDIWPRKTASHLAYLTGVSERAVKYWLSGTTRMSVEHVADLLRSDDGYEILEAIMGPDCKVDWWRATQVAHQLRNTRRALRREEIRLAEQKAQMQLLVDQQ